jgi:hypothetical protein
MKPFEVAVFKQVLESRGMVTPFINLSESIASRPIRC